LFKLERDFDRDRADVLRLARAGYLDRGVLNSRYLEEVRPYLLNKNEWHGQTLELPDCNDRCTEFQLAQGSQVTRGPQKITRNGRMVVSAEGRERKTKRIGTLAEYFASSPLRASGLKVERSKDKLRSADL
jgi:hypothetical protein